MSPNQGHAPGQLNHNLWGGDWASVFSGSFPGVSEVLPSLGTIANLEPCMPEYWIGRIDLEKTQTSNHFVAGGEARRGWGMGWQAL